MARFDTQSFDFRSFQFAEHAVVLSVLDIVLTGGKEEIRIDETPLDLKDRDESVDLFEYLEDATLDAWDEVQITCGIQSDSALGDLFVQVVCEDTRLEVAQAVSASKTTVLELPTADLRKDVLLRAVCVDPSNAGLVTGESAVLTLVMDRPKVSVGGLRVEWDEEHFKDCPKALSILDFSNPGELVLYLNDGLQEFRILMQSHKRGVVGQLRKYLLSQLEADTWMALGKVTVSMARQEEVDLDNEALSDDELEEALNEEYQGYLKQIADIIKQNPPDRLVKTARYLNNPEWYEFIRTRIQTAKKGGGLGLELEKLIDRAGKAG